MKRIAFHLNCLEHGGAERVVSNLANRFAKEGYEVFLATEWYGEVEYEIDPRVTRIHVGMKPEDEKKSRAAKILLRIRYLRQFLRDVKPDVLVAFDKNVDFRALTAARGTGVPVVISIRQNPVGYYDGFIDQLRIRLLYPHAAGCVYQTAMQREFFRPYLQENTAIILNPVSRKYVGVPKPAERRKEVVQSARLVDFKNQSMLLDAFFVVHEKHPDYCLKIYGSDSGDGTRQILEKKIAEHKAQDYVLLMGNCDRLEQELTKAAVYAHSSDWEGLPNSLIEAMALGLPVVATDCPCGGPAELIEEGENGLLVPVGDAKAMAEGILRLIEDPALAERLGENARRVADRCSEDTIYEQWREYLEAVLRRQTLTPGDETSIS